MSALTSNGYGARLTGDARSAGQARSAARRDYRLLLGATYPLFVAGVALRRLVFLPADAVRPASFIAAVRSRAAAVIPFAFMG